MNVIQQIYIAALKQSLYLRGIDLEAQTITYNDSTIFPAKTVPFSFTKDGISFDKYVIPFTLINQWMDSNEAVDQQGNISTIPPIYASSSK